MHCPCVYYACKVSADQTHTQADQAHTQADQTHTHKQTRRQVRHVTMCMYANNHANTQAQHANAYGQPF